MTTATVPEMPPAPETLYGYVWHTNARRQIWLVLLSVAVFPITMVPLELQRRIINDAIGRLDVALLAMLCAAYFGALLLQGSLKFATGVTRGITSEAAVRNLRRLVYCGSVGDGPGSPSAGPARMAAGGSTVSMVVAEVEPLGGFVGDSISVPLVQVGILTSVFGYMLYIQPWIAMAGFLLCMPQVYFVPRIQRAINRHAERRIALVRELGEQLVSEGDSPRPPGEPGEQFERRLDGIYRHRVKIYCLKHLLKFLNNLLHHLGPLTAFLLGGWLVTQGRTDIGTIVAFASGFERIADPWRELIGFYRRASEAQVRYRLVAGALGTCA